MTVMDVLNLGLQDGINCMKTPYSGGNDHHSLKPVSKCLLVGFVVYANFRRDGTMAYVLDDGTGLIDCVHWSTGDMHDIYHLPSLDGCGAMRTQLSVGDMVRVFGKIECLALTRMNGGEKEVVIREVQASLIEPVLENMFAVEAQHWRNCIRIPHDGPDSYLELLGQEIQSQVEDRTNLPAASDSNGLWRVFGTSCRCKLDYMENLLYCHCQAKIEPLDPANSFRDMLLRTLLTMETACSAMLVFTYKNVKCDAQIRAMAAQVLQTSTSSSVAMVDKLFLNTFRALRHDGILHLLDNHRDEYLLISRDRVLEPFVRSQLVGSSQNQKNYVDFNNAPPYLTRIHNDRLLFIKRCILSEANIKKSK